MVSVASTGSAGQAWTGRLALAITLLALLMLVPARAVADDRAAPPVAKGTTAEAQAARAEGARIQAIMQDGPSPTSARLQVEGDGSQVGVVRLEGEMVVFGLLPQEGTIWFRDDGGDGRIFVDGRRPELREGETTTLRERSGRFYVSGSNVTLQLRGERISLSAAGRGEAWLMGDGRFRLDDGDVRRWFEGPWRPPSVAVAPSRLSAALVGAQAGRERAPSERPRDGNASERPR